MIEVEFLGDSPVRVSLSDGRKLRVVRGDVVDVSEEEASRFAAHRLWQLVNEPVAAPESVEDTI